MATSLIRVDRWPLRTTHEQRAWVVATQREYRAYAAALMGVVWTHWSTIDGAGSRCHAVEGLIHATARRPVVRYPYFDRRFHKFPSYLRRAAIEASLGQVSSFIERQDRWQSGRRNRRTAAPPKRTGANELNPALYRGQNVKFDTTCEVAEIKVWNTCDWIWTKFPILHKRQRHLAPQNKALSPMLLTHGSKIHLAVPFEIPKKRLRTLGAPVCAVDLGINTTATASIVHRDGTVTARRLFHRATDIDRRDKGLVAIRGKARKTAKLSHGFCRALYRKARHRNIEMSRRIGRGLIEFAQTHGAEVVVFESLKGWRPRGGQKRSPLRQRFHGWLHRALVHRVEMIAEGLGLRVWFVNPKNTSALAYDGSGFLKRDAHNASLTAFSTGKRYNADLNASYNIGARYWLDQRTGRNDRQTPPGKSPGGVPRIWVTFSTLWELAQSRRLTTGTVTAWPSLGVDAATTTAQAV
ncbi:MAG TPA: transposase [Nevskiaceae bacterium]|nr:transposase [Nevskiaceae bacterium]